MEYKETIENIANYFLSKEELSPKKLQKIVYYAFSWYIVNNNDNQNDINKLLFKESPEAWVHGPVFTKLYDKYKQYGWHSIPKVSEPKISSELKDFLDEIWNVFGKYDGDTLELMTHNENPWISARKDLNSIEPSNEELSLECIHQFYSSL